MFLVAIQNPQPKTLAQPLELLAHGSWPPRRLSSNRLPLTGFRVGGLGFTGVGFRAHRVLGFRAHRV